MCETQNLAADGREGGRRHARCDAGDAGEVSRLLRLPVVDPQTAIRHSDESCAGVVDVG